MKLTKLQRNTAALSLASLGILSVAGIVSAQTTSTTRTRHTLTQAEIQTHDAMRSAIKNALATDDYEAFKTAMTQALTNRPAGLPANAPTPTILTQAQFDTLVEVQKLRDSGDEAGAKKLLDDAGIKGPMAFGMSRHHGHEGPDMTNLTDAQKTAMDQAHTLFEAGKADEAKAILKTAGITIGEHKPFAEMKAYFDSLTDAQKATLKQAHDLMEAGDKAGADKLLSDAGITLPPHPNDNDSDDAQTTK